MAINGKVGQKAYGRWHFTFYDMHFKTEKNPQKHNTKIEIHCAYIVQHCSIYTYTTSYTFKLDISTNTFIHLGTYAVPVCPPTIAVFA